MKTLAEITKGQNWVGLGIAGNQAEHLNQAGEADDFKDVVALENAPKGIFPWYLPGSDSFLAVNPLSSSKINLNGDDPLQPEPEIALVVKFQYADSTETSDKVLDGLSVIGFSAFNDCSRRIPAAKISHKKNWGEASQGMAEAVIPINDFTTAGGAIDQYRLCCYLERDGELLQYGKDTAVSDYCYLNETLVEWIVKQINTQTDNGPLEAIGAMLAESKPAYGVIGIGATCYSDFGNSEQRFLEADDTIIVAAYDSRQLSKNDVEKRLAKDQSPSCDDSLIILRQAAVRAHTTSAQLQSALSQ